MTGFRGTLEWRAECSQDFKEKRLQRLQQVRLQEKIMSTGRCEAYRKVLGVRNVRKIAAIKGELLIERELLHDNLTVAWQSSLVDTGYAHRTASVISLANNTRQKGDEELSLKRRNHACQRGRAAANEGYRIVKEVEKVVADRLERESVRAITSASDREDARATAEAKAARQFRKVVNDNEDQAQCFHSQKTTNMMTVARQSAVRIQDRGSILKDTNVVRISSADINESSYQNRATEEERVALKKQWSTVLTEMRHRKATASRAQLARRTNAETHQAEAFRTELSLLSMADRALCRSTKVRNLASVVATPHMGDATPAAVRNFEREFMYSPTPFQPDQQLNVLEESATSLSQAREVKSVAPTRPSHGQSSPQQMPKEWEEKPTKSRFRQNSIGSTMSSQNLRDSAQSDGRGPVIRNSIVSQVDLSAPPAWSAQSTGKITSLCLPSSPFSGQVSIALICSCS